MSDLLEVYTVRFNAEAGKVVNVLVNAQKASKQAEKVLEEGSKTSSSVVSELGISFTTLLTAITVTAVASLAKVIKSVADANRRVVNFTKGTTTSAKSLKALENNFKQLGMSAGEADSNFSAFQKSVADYKYSGELEGQVKAFKTLGVAVLDSHNNTRDYYDILTEAGQVALKLYKGDQTKASEYLRFLGFSANTARLMVQHDGEKLKESLKAEASASVKVNDSYQKLSENLERSEEEFSKMFINMEERLQIFDKLLYLLDMFSGWATGSQGEGVAVVFSAIDGILDSIHAMMTAIVNSFGYLYDFLIQPIIKFLDLIGEYTDNANGGKYKSREPWFGDGHARMTHDSSKSYFNISGNSSFNGGGGYVGSGYDSAGEDGEILRASGGFTLSIPEEQFDRSNIPSSIKNIAKEVSRVTGVPADFLAVHLGFESAWGKSALARNAHNYGGVTATKSQDGYYLSSGGRRWRAFSSDSHFAREYGAYLLRKFPSVRNVKSMKQYMNALHHGKGGVDYAPSSENGGLSASGENMYDVKFRNTYRSRFGSSSGAIRTVHAGSPSPVPQSVKASHISAGMTNGKPTREVQVVENVTNNRRVYSESSVIQSAYEAYQPAMAGIKAS